ncbi:DUF742 domain-containing protein [Micromonospora purpureochromogenes]|uniref:DUF742 domain-containing protein n=1 Tax=Micromonospora purpureochromogenes TaxID=47872 RepID=A0ABX2RJL7_9ACTN|nr:DUF742 domain-containing protein [Micromonospora purpureochromogenes]NYF56692.1 hypothetical protein [Micromonospora purpureochromogenes]
MNDFGPRIPDPRMIPAWQPASRPQRPPEVAPPRADHRPPEPDGDDRLVRPFLVTGGRTRPLQDGLRVETMVHAAPAAMYAPLKFELRHIVELCQTPRSIAEIAAALGVPLGVARVLVADLVVGNLVWCDEPAEIPIHVIERIRDRVRAL